jgi:hypothetical protein
VLAYHNGNLSQALVELFPNIGLNFRSKFFISFLYFINTYYKSGKILKIENSFLKTMQKSTDSIHSFLKIGILLQTN